MAVVSSHTLNSADGTHAGRIAAILYKIETSAARTVIFETETDEGGRLSQTISEPDPTATYELVFQTGAYFQACGQQGDTRQIVNDVVIRFTMPEPEEQYHLPLMLAPNSYSVWWSS